MALPEVCLALVGVTCSNEQCAIMMNKGLNRSTIARDTPGGFHARWDEFYLQRKCSVGAG